MLYLFYAWGLDNLIVFGLECDEVCSEVNGGVQEAMDRSVTLVANELSCLIHILCYFVLKS